MKIMFTWSGRTQRRGSIRALVSLACFASIIFGAGLVQAQSGPAFQRTPNPDAVGLWTGEITLRAVSYPATATVEPTQGTAQMRIILHVDADGKVRLLKDAIIAAKAGSASEQLVLTKASLLASLPVARTAPFNAVTGQRFSTVAFDFTDNDANPTDAALDLAGGLGQNLECVGSLVLDKSHPTNPFQHKFHPDHANEGAKAYTITRSLKLQFIQGIQNVAGVDQLSGTYEETITGLHRAPLTVQGTIFLTRVSGASAVNQ